jgi:hypothetical protein
MAAADTVRICAGGDVTLGTNLDTAWARRMTGGVPDALAALRAPDTLALPLRGLMGSAGVVVLNAEGAIGEGPVTETKCTLGRRFCYLLRMPVSAAWALRGIADTPAVVVANVANNHTHDAGEAGFRATLAILDSAGVRVTGADTVPTLVPVGDRDTLAVLGFSSWSSPGVADTDAVRRVVARAAARYRWVIVTAHLGAEGRQAQHTGDSVEHFAGEIRGNAVAFARAAADAGAQLVIGHGPHVLRAAEWWHGALIFYSLGNLVDYGPFGLGEPMRRGAVACATLDSTGAVRDVVLRATRQFLPGAVAPDPERRALKLVSMLSRADFPITGVAVDRATGVVSRFRPSTTSRPAPAPAGPTPPPPSRR